MISLQLICLEINYSHFVCFAVGTNGKVTYGGISVDVFHINPVTGVITTTGPLDREFQEYYTVTGTAYDFKIHTIDAYHKY